MAISPAFRTTGGVHHEEPRLQYGAAASLAAASQALKDWDDTLAKQCLETAIRLWAEEHAHPTAIKLPPGLDWPNFAEGIVRGEEWKATLELLIATNGLAGTTGGLLRSVVFRNSHCGQVNAWRGAVDGCLPDRRFCTYRKMPI